MPFSGCTGGAQGGRIPPVSIGKAIGYVLLAGIITFVLFEVNFVFDIGRPDPKKVPDPAIEADYQRCYKEKDDKIHTTVFGTIDNPDVQKLLITSSRAQAAEECRAEYPARLISVEQPFRFDLLDLEPRFW